MTSKIKVLYVRLPLKWINIIAFNSKLFSLEYFISYFHYTYYFEARSPCSTVTLTSFKYALFPMQDRSAISKKSSNDEQKVSNCCGSNYCGKSVFKDRT